MNAYDPELWHDFAIALVGAAAALCVLAFVAISFNLEAILKETWLPGRAGAPSPRLVVVSRRRSPDDFVDVPVSAPEDDVLGGRALDDEGSRVVGRRGQTVLAGEVEVLRRHTRLPLELVQTPVSRAEDHVP